MHAYVHTYMHTYEISVLGLFDLVTRLRGHGQVFFIEIGVCTRDFQIVFLSLCVHAREFSRSACACMYVCMHVCMDRCVSIEIGVFSPRFSNNCGIVVCVHARVCSSCMRMHACMYACMYGQVFFHRDMCVSCDFQIIF